MSGGKSASLKVLYDGWALVYAPLSPAALHLLAILSSLPVGVEPAVALPAAVDLHLPGGAHAVVHPTCPGGHSGWLSDCLPELAGAWGADMLHTFTTQPLHTDRPVVISSMDTRPENRPRRLGFFRRLPARSLFWPADLPLPPPLSEPLHILPPLVHPAFSTASAAGISASSSEEPFVLFPAAASPLDLQRALAAWSWAVTSLGAGFRLVCTGLGAEGPQLLSRLTAGESWRDTVAAENPASLEELASWYCRAAVVLHTGPVEPWEGPLSHALAAARPVAAFDEPAAQSRLGPAGYLTPPNDPRAMGAALITLLIEENFAGRLSAAAAARSAGWPVDFGAQLLGAYHQKTLSPDRREG